MTVEILAAGALRGVAVGDDLLRLHVRGLASAYVLTLDARTIPNPTRVAHEATSQTPRLGAAAPTDTVLWAPMPPRLQDHADITVVNLSAGGGVLPGTHARWTNPINRNGTAAAYHSVRSERPARAARPTPSHCPPVGRARFDGVRRAGEGGGAQRHCADGRL